MPTLWLKFGIDLEDDSVESSRLFDDERHHGPLFHRWLPNGEKDAIALNTGDSNADLKIWFEPRGFVNDHGFLQFDYNRREVDENLITRQAVLDAGPLVGLLRLDNLSEPQIGAVQENKTGDENYLALGKRIVKIVYPPVSRFINILRTNYGQYWINELTEWDSRHQSLGSYLSAPIQTKWSLDDGKTWSKFIPNKPQHETIIELAAKRGYREYLTKQDWDELRDITRGDYQPALAALVLTTTHRLLEQNDVKEAIIDAVTALEIALNDFLRGKLEGNKALLDKMQAFWNLPLPAQIISIAAVSGVSGQDLECAIRLIDVRNGVVHEGCDPPDKIEREVSKLLEIVSTLLSGPKFKFPHVHHGNWIRSEEEWDNDPFGGAQSGSRILIRGK